MRHPDLIILIFEIQIFINIHDNDHKFKIYKLTYIIYDILLCLLSDF